MFRAVDIAHGLALILSRTRLHSIVDFEVLLALEAVEQNAAKAPLKVFFQPCNDFFQQISFRRAEVTLVLLLVEVAG